MSELTIRPAGPEDRPAMERICAQTWEWGDYIPQAWDAWLADKEGLVVVGEVGGQVVALSNVAFQTPDQAWLEGMRVDPAFRRRGIAGAFLQHNLDYARQRGARVVRLGTSISNKAVQTIAARTAMDKVGSYVLWVASPLPCAVPPVFLGAEDFDQAEAFLKKSCVLAHNHDLLSTDWSWQELSTGKLAEMLSQGQVAALRAAGGDITALATLQFDPDDRVLWIGYADQVRAPQPRSADRLALRPLEERPALNDVPALTRLATTIRAHAARIDALEARIMLSDAPGLRDAFRAAGYGPGDWEGELWIYEQRVASVQGNGHEA